MSFCVFFFRGSRVFWPHVRFKSTLIYRTWRLTMTVGVARSFLSLRYLLVAERMLKVCMQYCVHRTTLGCRRARCWSPRDMIFGCKLSSLPFVYPPCGPNISHHTGKPEHHQLQTCLVMVDMLVPRRVFLKDTRCDFAHLEDLLRLATAQARAADEQIQDTWATKDVSVVFVKCFNQQILVGRWWL